MSTETKNYITPVGWQALKDELYQLVNKERPEIVQIVNWAASNGDRSENGDYLYGKRRMHARRSALCALVMLALARVAQARRQAQAAGAHRPGGFTIEDRKSVV